MPKNNKIMYAAVGVCVILAAVFFFTGRKGENTGAAYENNLQPSDMEPSVHGETETGTSGNICVYVCGEVNEPDVYYVVSGGRVADAIEAAGGATDSACLQALNLAEILSDGQRLYVPSHDEANEAASFFGNDNSSDSGGLVNINTADAEELMTLPGIGESKARSIIAYREENGAYKALEDIMNVSGIKEAAFSKIKDLICV